MWQRRSPSAQGMSAAPRPGRAGGRALRSPRPALRPRRPPAPAHLRAGLSTITRIGGKRRPRRVLPQRSQLILIASGQETDARKPAPMSVTRRRQHLISPSPHPLPVLVPPRTQPLMPSPSQTYPILNPFPNPPNPSQILPRSPLPPLGPGHAAALGGRSGSYLLGAAPAAAGGASFSLSPV